MKSHKEARVNKINGIVVDKGKEEEGMRCNCKNPIRAESTQSDKEKVSRHGAAKF